MVRLCELGIGKDLKGLLACWKILPWNLPRTTGKNNKKSQDN